MRRDTQPCDRCGAAIEERHPQREPFLIPIPTENHREYVTKERVLCDECRVALLEFIDGDDAPDRSHLIGGRLRADVAQSLASAAVQLEQTADEITEGGQEGDE